MSDKWEYCELYWREDNIRITKFETDGPNVKVRATSLWVQEIAQLGQDGWELVSVVSSPTNIQEYWFYFKRKLP